MKVNLAHHPLDALCVVIDLGHVFAQDPPGNVLRGGWAGCCLENPWPRSSMSIRGWSTWLMRMRLAMVSRRRSSVGEGVGGMGGSWTGFLVRAGLLGRGGTGGGTCGGEAPAITLTHECFPMQTKRSLTKPRSATSCFQTCIQSVASRPGYFVHSAIPLNPGGDFVMICSTMGRLGRFSGSR